MTGEIDSRWKDDPVNPSMEHLSFLFFRELRLMWRYRFFYRELVPLLRDDAVLRGGSAICAGAGPATGRSFSTALLARGLIRRLVTRTSSRCSPQTPGC